MKTISKRTREILTQYGISLKKKYGQNFLTDENVLHRIVEAAGITNCSGVIEIGPGIGSLTERLVEASGKVLAIEIDDQLIPVIQHLFQERENLEIIHGDILQVNLQELIDTHLSGMTDIHVVANLPYYITSPILIRLISGRYSFKNMVMMVQKEVADRLTASPGTKDYGSITVFVQYFARTIEAIKVPSSVFIPRPNVDSSVVVFHMHDQPPIEVPDERLFFKIVRASFAQRRKTLLNTLHANMGIQDKECIKECLLKAGIDPKRRGETLSIEEFGLLTMAFFDVSR